MRGTRVVAWAVCAACWNGFRCEEDEFLVRNRKNRMWQWGCAPPVFLAAISSRHKEIHVQVVHIAASFPEFTTAHVFARHLGHRSPAAAEAAVSFGVCAGSAQPAVDA